MEFTQETKPMIKKIPAMMSIEIKIWRLLIEPTCTKFEGNFSTFNAFGFTFR